MTRKKSTTRPTEPQSPWVEIVPRPWKQVKAHYRCCVCDRNLPIMVKDQLEIVPVAYLVDPAFVQEAQRAELGQLCQGCLQCVLEDDPGDYTKRISTIMYFVQERLRILSTLGDHKIAIPPEAAWIAAAAEGIAGTSQELRDLAAATGLAKEEIVRRLIAGAKPQDL
jgi:hypothetical protein